MRVLRTFPKDLVGFIMESCEDAKNKYSTKTLLVEEKLQKDEYKKAIRELEDVSKADKIATQKDVPILGEEKSEKDRDYAGQRDIVIPGEEKLQDRDSDSFPFIPPPMDLDEMKQIINETTAFGMEQDIEQLISFLEEIKKGNYLFSGGAIYDKNALIAASAPKRFDESWEHGIPYFIFDGVMHTTDDIDRRFGDDIYAFIGEQIDSFNTVESAVPTVLLKKRNKPKRQIKYEGNSIIIYDDKQNTFKEAHFDGEDYQPEKNGKIIDPNDLTMVEEPFLVYYIGEPPDLVKLVEREKQPNTFLSVGKITRGVHCPSMDSYRWILPLARFQLADFERIHEELGIYARELIKS